MLPEGGIILRDTEEAYNFLGVVPSHIKDKNGGKGVPIIYSLLPVETIAFSFQLQFSTPMSLAAPTEELLASFIAVFDDFQT